MDSIRYWRHFPRRVLRGAACNLKGNKKQVRKETVTYRQIDSYQTVEHECIDHVEQVSTQLNGQCRVQSTHSRLSHGGVEKMDDFSSGVTIIQINVEEGPCCRSDDTLEHCAEPSEDPLDLHRHFSVSRCFQFTVSLNEVIELWSIREPENQIILRRALLCNLLEVGFDPREELHRVGFVVGVEGSEGKVQGVGRGEPETGELRRGGCSIRHDFAKEVPELVVADLDGQRDLERLLSEFRCVGRQDVWNLEELEVRRRNRETYCYYVSSSWGPLVELKKPKSRRCWKTKGL